MSLKSLKFTCPKCSAKQSLPQPLPKAGQTIQCIECGAKVSMTYPEGALDSLRAKGYVFEGDGPHAPPPTQPVVEKPPRSSAANRSTSTSSHVTTEMSPKGEREPQPNKRSKAPSENAPTRKKWSLWKLGLGFILLSGLGGVGAGMAVYQSFKADVPSVEELRDYTPPTVTTLYDRNGKLLGEIYEKRRYVREYERFPEHLVNSFLAAEDANFWQHSGVDFMGIVRAVIRNALKGKKAQGASTITQQVARNFLLSSEKTYTRKIKEAILAQRIEETFSKEHILYLYLNQIYLGSGAYGVEAAARVYFGKHVEDLTLPESAIIAGLPQRPGDYSPHRHWKKARARQEYVLGQLKAKGFIDEATYTEAINTKVAVVKEENQFLKQAPHYTEYVRRYLVETYGHEKVYNDGLEVVTACDLDLQKVAQDAVYEQVAKAGRSQGWEGATKTLKESEIQGFRDKQEEALREASAPTGLIVAEQEEEGSGPYPAPTESTLVEGTIYDAVVLEVSQKHAFVGIGKHEAIIPLSWSQWGYEPNFERSFKRRILRDLTEMLKRVMSFKYALRL